MILFRGTSKKKCESYKKKGIPIGENFTNRLKEAKRFGNCVISIDINNKNLIPSTQENEAHKLVKINIRYYKNKKAIKKFKIK